ncbi:MAG: portal protein [Magnetovibrio sp.]|nr:portal protein [Magnetovibrio sp.]
MDDLTPEMIVQQYQRAKDRRRTWEAHWQDCYDYTLPQRNPTNQDGQKAGEKLFDGTAPDAVDQLAASMLSNLTPPWAQWVGLMPGTNIDEEDRKELVPKLEKISTILQSHIDRSNFAIEIHQCYLDLVTVGTASLMLEENPIGESSAFRFTAVPMFDVVFEADAGGALNGTLRRLELTRRELKQRYPDAPDMGEDSTSLEAGEEPRIGVIEAVLPQEHGYRYMAVAETSPGLVHQAEVLSEGNFETSPFINFRWLKAPGEVYGRSPVMKALPDIKTANKVVELTLKNASIAVTGIWQADDDGVLNPANIKLVPGAIIPKAVGSQGLTPLGAPGRFDVSGLVLDGLRSSIRSALLADKLGQIMGPRMSATEVLERSAEMSRVLGATYGRLQSELLTPLISRAIAILRRRGEVPAVSIDGRVIDVDYKSPLARRQSQENLAGAMGWFETASQLGVVHEIVDVHKAARWLAEIYRVPESILLSEEETQARKEASVASPVSSDQLNQPDLSHVTETLSPSERAEITPSDLVGASGLKINPFEGHEI